MPRGYDLVVDNDATDVSALSEVQPPQIQRGRPRRRPQKRARSHVSDSDESYVEEKGRLTFS